MSIIGMSVGAVLPKHNHDSEYLKRTGGSVTGGLDITGDINMTGDIDLEGGISLTGGINMNGQALRGLAEPEEDTDVVTKGYVDTEIAGMRTTCTVTLAADGWEDSRQTVTVAGVTADSDVDVSPAPEGYTAYCEAGVYCSAQAAGSLTFVCTSVPTDDLSVNVRIWN